MILLKIIIGIIAIELVGGIVRKINTGKWFDKEVHEKMKSLLVEVWDNNPTALVVALLFITSVCWVIGHVTLLPFL